MTSPLTHLGAMPIETFLRDYWQQKPLLIRNAFPNFESPIDGDELAGLALEEEVESRLVIEHGKHPWELQHGPFSEETFAQLPASNWTLLVQAVDQWVPEINELLNNFRFIPNWRLDDIMVSFAPDQGSVGPHFDYYDVFLLQGLGKRRWKIGQQCTADSPHLQDTELNILQTFATEDEWLLEPGDMLYIPPGIAHWGIAEGNCMTYSIGFRAPNHGDILTELTHEIASTLTNDDRFSDPQLLLQANPGEISGAAISQLQDIIQQYCTSESIANWFGKYMTERKYLEEESDAEPLTIKEWQTLLQSGVPLWRHPAARLAFVKLPEHTLLFADGNSFKCTTEFAELLCQAQELDYDILKPLLTNTDNRQALHALITQESLLLDDDE